MHTACVWSEKTTVCRIFSCQRSHRGKYRPAESFGGRGALSPGPPWLTHSRGPNAPLRSFAVFPSLTSSLHVTCESACCSRAGALGVPGELARLNVAP